MTGPPSDLPLVFSRREALEAGYTVGQARSRSGKAWPRVRRGHFTRRELEAEQSWQAEVLAVLRAHRRPLVLSHAHAARAHGWPQPRGGWGPLSFTSAVPPARARNGVTVSVCALAEADMALQGQVTVTSPARTVVDCARRLPPSDALAITDAALRRADVTPAVLAVALSEACRRPGIERARRVVGLGDGRRETPLEAWSAWAFALLRVPTPRWQTTVCDGEGVFIGRVDAWWQAGVVGEADGRVKYRLAALERTGTVDADGLAGALDDERRRERELLRAGALVVRWEARDVLSTTRARRLAAQLRSKLDEASSGARFTGRVIDV